MRIANIGMDIIWKVWFRFTKFDIFSAILRSGKMNAFKKSQAWTQINLQPICLMSLLPLNGWCKNNAVLSALKWIWYEEENGQQVFHFQLSATNEVCSQVSFKFKRCVSAKCVHTPYMLVLWRFRLSCRSRRSLYVASQEANLFTRILWDFYDTNSNRTETSSQSIKFRGILRDW